MERFFDLVKRYPLWIAGAVLAIVLLIWFASRGGDGAPVSTITSIGPTDASVNANAQVQIAQMDYAAKGAANAAQIEALRVQADVAKSLGTLDLTANLAALETSKNITEIQAQRDMDIAGKTFDAQTSLATIVTNAQTTQAQIAANTATAIETINAGVIARKNELDHIGGLNALNVNWSLGMAQIAAGTRADELPWADNWRPQ